MNKIIKDQINQLKPSATLAINEESNKLKKDGIVVTDYKELGFDEKQFFDLVDIFERKKK